MQGRDQRRTGIAAATIVLALTMSGCSGLGYYVQAARGQWGLLSAARPIEDWLASRPLSQSDASGLERLAALVALDPAFRLAMVTPAGAVASGARAAAVLQRYLTGPALVPRERLIFAVSEFARPGQLELILMRLEEPR